MNYPIDLYEICGILLSKAICNTPSEDPTHSEPESYRIDITRNVNNVEDDGIPIKNSSTMSDRRNVELANYFEQFPQNNDHDVANYSNRLSIQRSLSALVLNQNNMFNVVIDNLRMNYHSVLRETNTTNLHTVS